jgi:hypothetical protein
LRGKTGGSNLLPPARCLIRANVLTKRQSAYTKALVSQAGGMLSQPREMNADVKEPVR